MAKTIYTLSQSKTIMIMLVVVTVVVLAFLTLLVNHDREVGEDLEAGKDELLLFKEEAAGQHTDMMGRGPPPQYSDADPLKPLVAS
jgi:1,4-dihydroxy-2-naphthoate octaprenyltransferase